MKYTKQFRAACQTEVRSEVRVRAERKLDFTMFMASNHLINVMIFSTVCRWGKYSCSSFASSARLHTTNIQQAFACSWREETQGEVSLVCLCYLQKIIWCSFIVSLLMSVKDWIQCVGCVTRPQSLWSLSEITFRLWTRGNSTEIVTFMQLPVKQGQIWNLTVKVHPDTKPYFTDLIAIVTL